MTIIPRRLSRIAARFRRAPSFTIIAAATLAIGIGANTAMFSVVNGVLLKPLPFDAPESLVSVWHAAPGMNIPQMQQSPATFFVERDESHVFETMGLWQSTAVSVTGQGEPERV